MTGAIEDHAHRGFVQRQVSRVYERLGARIVLALIVAAWAITVVTAALMVLVVHGYFDLSTGEWWGFLAMAEVAAIAGPAAVMFLARDAIRAMLIWTGPGRTVTNAPAAWNAVATYPPVVLRCATPVAVVLGAISLVVAAIQFDFPAWTIGPLALTLATAIAGVFVVVVFGLEFCMRPMLEDIAAHLPPDFDPTHRSWSVGARALVPLPVVTMVAAIGVAAFSDLLSAGPEQLVMTFGIALVIVGVASAIFFIVTRSALDPIIDLTAATKRVREGDLSATVPVVTADDLGRLAANFNQMLVQLRESHARIVAASDDARRKVERDLHDGAQQELVLLNLKLGLVERGLADDPKASAMLGEAKADLARALEQLRDLAHGIYPAALENDGLPGALSDAARRAAIPAHVECDGAGRYPRDVEAAVYFCCLEALQNAAKHAGEGAQARVRLQAGNGALRFEVADDGRGFDVPGAEASAGLQNMTDRIGALGGQLRIESAPGRGTTVKGSVPVR